MPIVVRVSIAHRAASRAISRITAVLALLLGASAFAVTDVPVKWPEGTVRGFPVMVDPHTQHVVASGVHSQWVSGHTLHVVTTFRFPDGRQIRETAVLLQGKQLRQLRWRYEDSTRGTVTRQYDLDFKAGQANALLVDENGKRKEWHAKLKIPRDAFAGEGFVFAIRNLHGQLARGTPVELTAVAFTPQPRMVKVKVSGGGSELVDVAGRKLEADKIVIHPEIPAVFRLFVHPPDNLLWFAHSPPPALLRARGPMQGSDTLVDTDVERPVSHPAPRSVARKTPSHRKR